MFLMVFLLAAEVMARGRGGGGRGGFSRGGGGVGGGRSSPNFSRSGPASGGSFGRGGSYSRPGGSYSRPGGGFGSDLGGGLGTGPGGSIQQPGRPSDVDRPSAGDPPSERQDRWDDRQDRATDRQEHRQDMQKEYYEDHHYSYGEFYEDQWKYTVGASLTMATFRSLSCTTTTVVVGSVTYYSCGGTWYNRAYSGGNVTYIVVDSPPGH